MATSFAAPIAEESEPRFSMPTTSGSFAAPIAEESVQQSFAAPIAPGSFAAPIAVEDTTPSAIPRLARSRPALGGTFAKGVRRGTKQSIGLAGQLLSLIGDETGLAGLVDIGDELVQEAFVEAVSNPARIGGFEDIESIRDFSEFIKQTLGEQVFNIGLAATGGGIGALLAKRAVSKAAMTAIARKAAERGAALKGAAAGTFGAFLPINTGEIIQEQRDAHEAYIEEAGGDYYQAEDYIGKPELGPSLALGAMSSALEVLGFGLVGKAIFGQAKKEVIDHTLGMVLARAGHTTVKALAAEGGTEAVQEAMVIASRKINDPTFSIGKAIASSEGLSRIAFAGASGAVVGGVLGGAGGVTTSAVQSAQVGMQRAKIRAQALPGVDALKKLGQPEGEGEVTSLFDLKVARKNMVAAAATVAAAAKEARRAVVNKLSPENQAAAFEAADEAKRAAVDNMSIEEEALKPDGVVDKALKAYRTRITDSIAALRTVLKSLPVSGELNQQQNQLVHDVTKMANKLIEEARGMNVQQAVANAEKMVTLASNTLQSGLADPRGVPVKKVGQMLNEAEKYANAALDAKETELKKSQQALRILKGRVENQGLARPLPAAQPKMSTPEGETARSLVAVRAKKKRATFIRGVTDASQLSKELTKLIARHGLVPRADPANDRVVVVRREDRETPLEELERSDFATPIDSIENPTIVTARDAAGGVIQNEAVPSDPVAVAEALSRGEQIGATAEARPAHEPITESVRELNDEAEALELGLTIGQVDELVDEQSTLYVRMPNSNRLMPAVLTLDDTLVREDGGKFALFDSEEQIDAALRLKTSKERFAELVDAWGLDNEVEEGQSLKDFEKFEKVKVGDKFVLRAQLPGSRTASMDRQVRKVVRRGNSTPNKLLYTILGTKNGKEVRLHLGEITKLGLMDEAGETIKNRPRPNPQTAFLTGLYTLASEYGYSIFFNPEKQGDRAIYGNTAYNKASPYNRPFVLGETMFSDWVLSEIGEGNLEAKDVAHYVWDEGTLTESEIAALSAEGLTLSEAPTSAVTNPAGREGEEARRGALPEEELEGRTPVVQEKEAPFYQRMYGNSKIFNKPGKEQIRDLISWPAGKQAVEFVTKMLNLKERIILFDEDTAASLIAAYQVQGTAAAKDYVTQIEGAITDDIAGRILRPSKNATKNERVMHVFISNRAERRAVQVGESVYRYSRGLTVMHEMGHLVQYTHLDRLSPKLRQKVLDSFGHETDRQNREAFANWMAKVAADINRQHKRKRTRNPEVDNIFVKIVADLRRVWTSLRRKLRYNKTFGDFVEALNSHAASQRGEAVDLTWKTPLARQMFRELEETSNGGLIPNNSAPTVAVPLEQSTKPLNIWYGSGENSVLSNLAKRPFQYKGKTYVTVEHAYQTWKSGAFDAATYGKLWKAGTKIRGKRADHKTSKALMLELIVASFEQNPKAQQALLATGNAELTHTQDRSIWNKEFPRILMGYRDSLRHDDMSIKDMTDTELRTKYSKLSQRVAELQGQDSEEFWTLYGEKSDVETEIEDRGIFLTEEQAAEALEAEEADDGGLGAYPDYDDMSIEAAVERTKDPVFRSYVEDWTKFGKKFVDEPWQALKTILYTADGELLGMGRVGTIIAKHFHSSPGTNDNSSHVFFQIRYNAAPFHARLETLMNEIPGGKIGLWEMVFNKKPSAKTKAARAQRERLNRALLLQTPLEQVDADLRPHVEEIRKYLNTLYRWFTSKGEVDVFGTPRQGMNLQLGERKDYYALMLDSQEIEQRRDEYEKLLEKHGMTKERAKAHRMKLTRDEDGGLSNGFHDEDISSDFLGPGFTSKKRRAKRELWTDALRKDLVDAGFYQKDIAVTLLAYTEMIARRATWEKRFHDPRRNKPTSAQIDRYKQHGLSINHPIAKLQLLLAEGRASGELNEWQYQRINADILPAYAGQLGLRTNNNIRKLTAGAVIYTNLRVLPFAIFSQFPDIATLAARGDFRQFQAALTVMLNRTTYKDAKVMAVAMGAIRQGLAEHVLNEQALNTFMTGKAKRINDLFFRYNQMEGWTNLMRTAAMVAGREGMVRNANNALKGDKAGIKFMHDLGFIERRDIAKVAVWDGFTTDDTDIMAGLDRYINEAMIRPDPSIRPVFFSDPGYIIFTMLKSFLYGFHKTFLERVGREAYVHHNLLPLLALGIMVLPFAAVGYELRRKLLGTSKNAPEGADYVQELFERGGLFGPWQMVMDMEQADQYGKPFILGAAGPAVEQVFSIFDSGDVAQWLPRAIPVVASFPAARNWVRDEFSE